MSKSTNGHKRDLKAAYRKSVAEARQLSARGHRVSARRARLLAACCPDSPVSAWEQMRAVERLIEGRLA